MSSFQMVDPGNVRSKWAAEPNLKYAITWDRNQKKKTVPCFEHAWYFLTKLWKMLDEAYVFAVSIEQCP